NSIVFRHIPDSNNAPRVFVFGTLGWIIVNLIIDVFGKGASAPNFFFIGGGAAILLGIYSLTLPNTPPVAVKGEKGGSMFDALKLFADPAFVIFAVCVVAASIPACGFYFPMAVPLFTECDFPSPVALTTLNQFSELIFMLALPFFAVRIGLKKCLLLGMAAWGLRYVFFMQLSFTFALLALFLHGFCYSFLYVASYMYADKKAPPALKASAQSLMAFLLLGVGQVAGSLLFSYQVNNNPAAFPEMQVAAAGKAISLPVWKDTNLQDSAWRYLNLSETVNSMLGQKGKPFTDLGVLDTNRDNVITWSELETIPESGFAYGEEGKTLTITKGELQDAFRKIAAINAKDKAAIVDTDIQVSRDQWLAVQMKNWKGILFSPIIIVAVCFLAFLVLGKDPVEAVAGKK
ncbi:MAG: MFS transporter, partial [Planctomycetaceae bacterium]|nr:MFS transporter [Planctomycetaceae bacterium]